MEKRHNMTGSAGQKLLILVCLVISAISVFYLSQARQPKSQNPLPAPNYALPLVEAKSTPQEVVVPSADGKFTLSMKEEKGKENVTYTFSVSGESGKKEIFSKSLVPGDSMSIPANTFSPDNKYVFLKETGSSGTSYFVLKTDGTPLKNGLQTIDFYGLFNQKYPDITNPKDVTGWGGLNLIIVNAYNPDGKVHRSFWYDVSSNSFIALSTRFD